jgi:septal ring factor EnvC (AmiA/AmiB activator)
MAMGMFVLGLSMILALGLWMSPTEAATDQNQTSICSLEGRLGALETQLGTVKQQGETLRTTVTTLDGRVRALENQLGAVKQQGDTLRTTLNSNYASLTSKIQSEIDIWIDRTLLQPAHFIHYIECSWRLADVLACSQKVSHPEMRLVSAAIGVSIHQSNFHF